MEENRTNKEMEEPVKGKKATAVSVGNRRPVQEKPSGKKKTEASVGNRRPVPEQTSGKKKTEASAGNRSVIRGGEKGATIYEQVWQEENLNTLEQKLLQGIRSAVYSNMEQFQKAAAGIQVLKAFSGKEYRVEKPLEHQGGESMVLLCRDSEDRRHVAKVYYEIERRNVSGDRDRRQVIKVRSKIVELSGQPESAAYMLPIEDVGLYSLMEGYSNYFEIQPFCEEGALSEREGMSVEELKPMIAQLNEALHYIHEHGLLHMDIKPENLYSYNGNIVIGDFGIAHIKEGEVRVTGAAGGTDGYRAPETIFIPNIENVSFILTSGADYYSLGVTLADLYKGSFIFEGIESEMASIMQQSHLPLPVKHDPLQEELQNLIDGLFQYDKTHRFGYEDVKCWMENPYYRVETQEGWNPVYTFGEYRCANRLDLFNAFSKDWNKAKQHLYNGITGRFLEGQDPEIANEANVIVEREYPADPQNPRNEDVGLFKFLKFLYPKGQLVWCGKIFTGLEELGDKFRTTNTPEGYGEMLKFHIVSMWMEGISDDEQLKKLVLEIEALAETDTVLACRWFGYEFAKCKEVEFLGHTISSVEELIDYAVESPQTFYGKDRVPASVRTEKGKASAYFDFEPDKALLEAYLGESTMDCLTNCAENKKLYGFLYSCKVRGYMNSLFAAAEQMKDFAKANAVLLLLDELTGECKSEVYGAKVRHFYKYFGPYGYLTQLQSMIGSKNIYAAQSSQDLNVLNTVALTNYEMKEEEYVDGEKNSVGKMKKTAEAAAKKATDLRNRLENNPFLVELGLAPEGFIECKYLAGCFAYEFLGEIVPLGYESVLSGAVKEADLS